MLFPKNNISPFQHAPFGRRILKISKPCSGGVPDSDQSTWTFTYYVNDASGNVMATYDYERQTDYYSMKLDEQMIYGSSRLGMRKYNNLLSTFTVSGSVLEHEDYDDTLRYLGRKRYEYTNHLGNVLLVTTDRKMGIDRNSDGSDDFYHAVVDAYYDYGPFGNVLHDRKDDGYRYGFQNQEKDDELYGADNAVNFAFRMHDTRLGRFLSVDPLASKYAYNSPYAFSENRVIDGIDLEGLEFWKKERDWTIEDVYAFQDYVLNATVDLLNGEGNNNDHGLKMTCDDMFIYLLVNYAAEHRLPLEFNDYRPAKYHNTPGGKISNESTFDGDYTDDITTGTKQFLYYARWCTNPTIMADKESSGFVPISENDLMPGDLMVVIKGHTVIVSSGYIEKDDQGNWVGVKRENPVVIEGQQYTDIVYGSGVGADDEYWSQAKVTGFYGDPTRESTSGFMFFRFSIFEQLLNAESTAPSNTGGTSLNNRSMPIPISDQLEGNPNR